MADFKDVPWFSAGSISVATILCWVWINSQFMPRSEIAEDHNEIKVQLYALQWQDAKRSVLWWKGQDDWPALRPKDREMYDNAEARVVHYRDEVLKAGGSVE